MERQARSKTWWSSTIPNIHGNELILHAMVTLGDMWNTLYKDFLKFFMPFWHIQWRLSRLLFKFSATDKYLPPVLDNLCQMPKSQNNHISCYGMKNIVTWDMIPCSVVELCNVSEEPATYIFSFKRFHVLKTSHVHAPLTSSQTST
jgi:hypothetical protein